MTDEPNSIEIPPEALGATIETAAFAAHADLLAPGLGFVGNLLLRYILSRTERAEVIVQSKLDRALKDMFPSPECTEAVATRAQRAGLVSTQALYSGDLYVLSPIGRELRDVVDVESVLRPEGGGSYHD